MRPESSIAHAPDSVSWPTSWRIVPLWSLFERVKDVGHPDEEMLSVYREYGVIKKNSRDDNGNKTAIDRNIYQLIDDGWLVVNRMKAWQGSVGISAHRGIISGHYICFRPSHHESPQFLNWLLRSDVYAHEYARLSRGVRPNQIEIDNDDLRTLPVRLPSIDEQHRIAAYLDAELAELDRLTILRQHQTTLALERLRALRDARVESLFENRGSAPLRRHCVRIEQGESPICEARPAGRDEWGVLKLSSIKGGTFLAEENKRLPSQEKPSPRFEVRVGDLLVTRANTPELVGDIAVVQDDIHNRLLPDLIYRVILKPDISPDFVAQVALSGRVRSLVQAIARGSSQSMVKLRGEDIRDWPIPHATTAEQYSFVEEMREAIIATDHLREALSAQLRIMAERKRALITAAVTGQIDVTTARGVG